MLMAHELRSLWDILVSALVKVMLQAAGFLRHLYCPGALQYRIL